MKDVNRPISSISLHDADAVSTMSICVVIGVVVVVMTTTIMSDVTGRCPKTCYCQRSSRTVYCSRRGLDAVPDTVPRNTHQLLLNGNHFDSPVLRRSNFSRLADVFKTERWSATPVERVSGLQQLYMSDCAISQIETGAFVDLVHLRWLDLSDNRLVFLNDATFSGLRLHQLFLNGNRRLTLDGGSPFANLTVSGLYLHDCQLSQLDPNTFNALIGSLRVLWLSDNRLSRLDRNLSRLFITLDHFRLAHNRLHCNCELQWLWRLYVKQRQRRHGNPLSEEAPECASPTSLKDRHLGELTADDLRCRAPTLADVEVTLTDDSNEFDNVGQVPGRRRLVLRCVASGDPTPTVFWIRPTTHASRLPTSVTQTDAANDLTEALLLLDDDDVQTTSTESSTFTCFATNVIGNATLTVTRVLRSLDIVGADTEKRKAAPKYTFDNRSAAGMAGTDGRQLFIQRDALSREKGGKACGISSHNETDASLSDVLFSGRDRRLKASSSLDDHCVQSSPVSDDLRQYSLKHLVGAVVITVLLTAASVIATASVYLRHRGFADSAILPQHPAPAINR